MQKKFGHNLARERQKFVHNLVRKRLNIGHTFTCERQKFGHNPAGERNELGAQFCGRSMKTWAQIGKHFSVQPSENTKTACTNLYLFSNLITIRAGRYVNQARRKGIRAGRKM